MNVQTIVVAIAAAAFAALAFGQQPAAAPPPTQADATFEALAPVVGPRTAELSGAGVQKIVARTGKGKRDIQVLTQWGPSYFGWPKGVTPVPFEIYVEAPNKFDVSAPGYTDAARARYVAAFDAVLPQAVRSAKALRAQTQRPKP